MSRGMLIDINLQLVVSFCSNNFYSMTLAKLGCGGLDFTQTHKSNHGGLTTVELTLEFKHKIKSLEHGTYLAIQKHMIHYFECRILLRILRP